MRERARVMDDVQMFRTSSRISHEIVEQNKGARNLALVGIRRRGVPLARAIAESIERTEGVRVPVGSIGISRYHDDLPSLSLYPQVDSINVRFPINGQTIVLVDDVILTGRTAHAAINALFSVGYAKKIQLAVLIDQGHRELPIQPDFVGRNMPTTHGQRVDVRVHAIDGENSVVLLEA